MSFIPSIVSAVVNYFKVNPRTCARIVVEAIGWIYVFWNAVDLIAPQAIAILRQVLVGLGAH